LDALPNSRVIAVCILADHIRGMLDELGISPAHLVGNSYGGACALRLALDTPSGSTSSC